MAQQIDILAAGISLTLPEDLPFDEWRAVGAQLGRTRSRLSWALGDWWRFGERRYGYRKALIESEDWDGPEFQTCRNAAWVCAAFSKTSRRRDILSFGHHAAVASLSADEADRLLDWCEEPLRQTGRPRSIRELRDEARRREFEERHRTMRIVVTHTDIPIKPINISVEHRPITFERPAIIPARPPIALDQSPGGGPVPPEIAALRIEPVPEFDRVAAARGLLRTLTPEERLSLFREFVEFDAAA